MWTAVSSQDVNGELISYKVLTVRNDSADQGEDDEQSRIVLVCDSSTDANVSMLDAFTVYNIKVAVQNHIGKGNYSEPLECITGEAGRLDYHRGYLPIV